MNIKSFLYWDKIYRKELGEPYRPIGGGASVTYTFANSTTANATEVNQNFTDLVNEFNATTGHDHDGTDAKTVTKVGEEIANGTGTVTISALGPTAVVTATISAWAKVTVGSVVYYIPLWK